MRPEIPSLLSARGLCFSNPGHRLFAELSFDIGPGLTLVQGGDGRGKSTLLRIIASEMTPQSGAVQRNARTLFDSGLLASANDQTIAQTWLQEQRALQPEWSEPASAQWADAFALEDHLAKPLYMLSTGSRRKLGLVAAAASGAELTLLDCPFGALDAASCRVLNQMLQGAARDRRRAWVLADYQRPAGIAREQLAGFIDLGD